MKTSTTKLGFRTLVPLFKILPVSLFLSFLLILQVWPTVTSLAQTYPSGFSQVQVVNSLSNPTVFSFAPDGRIFVAEQSGSLRVIKNGALLATPFVQLTVNASGERGLIGMTLDPNFATNKYIYLYYTVPTGTTQIHNRVSRFTANGDVALAGSEKIILELDPLSSANNHNGGAMQFGPDGKLYIAVGENAYRANAQNLDTYHGKLLRINPDGTVPSGNPYTSGSEQRKRVWAYGLRNPYTIDFQPGTGRLFVNDVGEATWEEVNDATAGGLNFGWPAAEGNSSNSAYKNPIYAYRHGTGDGVGCAITGGVFFNPTNSNYPASYIGKYFYQDLCNSWINFINVSGTPAVRSAFASLIPGQSLSISVGNDGNLYYLSRTNGALYKIIYTNTSAPAITSQPANLTVSAGQSATFRVSASGATPLTYQWQKNNVNITGATGATYTLTNTTTASAGQYRVIVKNSAGSATSNAATLTVTTFNAVPIAKITSPANATAFRILVFSKTAGFKHTSIPSGIAAIQKLGQENNFRVDTTKNAALFTSANLKNYQAVVFLNTTLNVLNAEQQVAFERYIQAGNGFVGIHSAADTEYDWPWYNKLVGAYFASHPSVRKATMDVVHKTHAATVGLPARWERTDEWYNFKSMNPDIKVLLKLDETTYTGGTQGSNHPIAWYHEYDGGRAFYTGLGHTEASFSEPLMLRHILGGIKYAMGNKTTYRAGTNVAFAGTGTDQEDGTLPASAFKWTLDFHHDTHKHDGPPIGNGIKSGSFTIPNQGETATNVWYRLKLTVTDSKGLTSRDSIDLKPRVVSVNLATNPAGLQLNLNSQVKTTPYSQNFVSGMVIPLTAPSPQTRNGVTYRFSHWSTGTVSGGNIIVPDANTTYTAVFASACTASGTILREYWANVIGTAPVPVTSTPTSTTQLTSFEAPSNVADNYGQRIRGYICAPSTGNYTFYIASDDHSELWLSTNDNPATKQKIAFIAGWTNAREWTKYASQKSAVITLQANTRYYIEALHKEGSKGDNLAVGWIKPGSSVIAVIPGSVLSPATGSTAAAALLTNSKPNQKLDLGQKIGNTFLSHPNPFTHKVTFTFSFAQEEEYTVKIYHASGALVKAFSPGKAAANALVQLEWATEKLAAGLYLVRLETKSGVQTTRIVRQ